MGAIGKAGQRVVNRRVGKPRLRLLISGDIGLRSNEPNWLSFGVANRDATAPDPAVTAVAMEQTMLAFKLR